MGTKRSQPTTPEESSSSTAERQPQTSTTDDLEATVEAIFREISKPSADDTTDGDTEYTGREPIDFALTLSTEEAKKWVVKRLAAYQEAIVEFCRVCIIARSGEEKKTVSECEWDAYQATEGLTRAIPNEQVIYKWLLERT